MSTSLSYTFPMNFRQPWLHRVILWRTKKTHFWQELERCWQRRQDKYQCGISWMWDDHDCIDWWLSRLGPKTSISRSMPVLLHLLSPDTMNDLIRDDQWVSKTVPVWCQWCANSKEVSGNFKLYRLGMPEMSQVAHCPDACFFIKDWPKT